MAKTTAPVSSVKHNQQPASRGSTNTYKLTQAQHDTVSHSGLYSQLGRRGRERDGGQREEKDGKDVRGRQMETESGGKEKEREEEQE